MAPTLESFCHKHGLYLISTETIKKVTVIGKSGKDIHIELEWRIQLSPPVLERFISVKSTDGSGMTLFHGAGRTEKEARESLLERIRGNILEYELNCADNCQIKVPKNLY